MPRPHASPEIKALALDFACVVTTDEGADGSSFVARHGPHSIYAVLTRCCVGAIRDDTPESNRKGISEAEFLRTLAERAKPVHNREFLRYRDRKAVKMSEDPTGAGMCMFRNVRWRSPANPTDLKYLREQHKSLSKEHPLVAGTVLFLHNREFLHRRHPPSLSVAPHTALESVTERMWLCQSPPSSR